MRAQGRCAGCQETGPLKRVEWHLLSCGKWAALYLEDRTRALGAAQEYARWRAEDKPGERSADLGRRVADTVAQRARSVGRFKRPDPLED
jgi:hypothetical protein